MKRHLLPTLFTAVALLVASHPLMAAPKKSDARNAELVAALQAVSPDPLGGRLGLAAATASATALPATTPARNVAVDSRQVDFDSVAYLRWKAGRRS